MVDKNLVLRKLSELDDYLEQINEFSGITAADYAASWKTQRIVERTLQIAIEVCADIGNHIVADQGFRTPKSYADTFEVLGEERILPSDLVRTMQDMAKFRNIVVHGYDKIDEAIVVSILRARLGDFSAFKEAVLTLLTG